MKREMVKWLALTSLVVGVLSACGGQADNAEAINSSVQETLAALPPEVVTVESPVTVEVPVTVMVPVTVPVQVTVVTAATEAPAAPDAPADDSSTADDTAPVDSPSGEVDPRAGINTAPMFDEDFLFPDYWDQFDNEFGTGVIENEVYVLTNHLTERMIWASNGRRGTNFYYQLDTTLTSGCKERDHYGMVFRMIDDGNFYAWGISCEGRYQFLRRVDGQNQVLVEWTSASAIQKFGAFNRLGLRAEGSQFSLYANDTYLTTVTDETFSAGRFGFYVGSRLTAGMQAVYDNAIAYPIP